MKKYLISKGGYQLAQTQELNIPDDFDEMYETKLWIEKVRCTPILFLRSVTNTRLGQDVPKAQR